jgi:hypothetical protein
MIDSDTIIHEALKRRLGEKSLQIVLKGTDVSVKPFRDLSPVEMRHRAKEHGLHLHHGTGYVAVSQWNVATDETTYYVVRE